MSSRCWRWTTGLLVLFGAMGAASAIDVPLTYHRHPEDKQVFLPYGNIRLELKLAAPEGTWKLPELQGKQPLYALVEVGETKRLLVFARQKEGDDFYNRLYYDSNANGDLTDDNTIVGTIEKEEPPNQYWNIRFPSVDTTYQTGGKTLSYCLRARGAVWNPEEFKKATLAEDRIDEFFYLSLDVECSYSGKFTIENDTYSIALGDTNGNGRFDDKARLEKRVGPRMRSDPAYYSGDQFYLSTERRPDYRDGWKCGDLLLLKGQLYEVAIDIPAARVTLTQTKQSLVPLKLGAETERLSICSENDEHYVMMLQPGTAVNVPKGKYRLMSYQMRRKDKDGNPWLLAASAAKDSAWVNAEEGGNAVLSLGEPFVPFAEVAPWSVRNDQVRLQFCAEGAGKELVSDLARLSGDGSSIAMSAKRQDRPKEPSYKIITGEGEVATQGDFEYG